MAERFYLNCPLGLGTVSLHGPEAHHLAVVCRAQVGEQVTLFNGDGREYDAVIRAVAKKAVELDLTRESTPERERTGSLCVAAPLPKGDRAQFLVEKLTELGVTAFVPLKTARSVVHPGDAKLEKLERYVIEASKQCGRTRLMRIEKMQTWPEMLAHSQAEPRKRLAHFGGGTIAPIVENCVLAVGPEGGFTEEEVNGAKQAGWEVVSLGPRILRVETAAVVLAAMCGLG